MTLPRISIIGCGRLGLPLGQSLARQGFTVLGSTTREEKLETLRQAAIKPHILKLGIEPEGDIEALLDTDILVVMISPSMTNPQAYVQQLQGLAKAAEGKVEKVIYISVTAVYPQDNTVVREEDATHEAPSFMGIPWLQAEECFTHNTAFKTTVIRFAGLMGKAHNPGRYFAGREMTGGDTPVNMIHDEDATGILERLIEKDSRDETECWGEAFNASADQNPEKRSFYSKACEVAGLPLPTFTEGEASWRIVNGDKLKRVLGYTFKYPNPLTALEA